MVSFNQTIHRPSSSSFNIQFLDDQVSESSVPAEPAQADVPPPTNNRQNQKSKGGPAARGGKYYARGGKSSIPGDESAAAAAVDDSQKKCIPPRLSFFSFSNYTQSKVLVMVEAGAPEEVGVAVEKVAVVDVPTTSTVKLAKRAFSSHSFSLLLTPIPATPTRRFIKAGVARTAIPNSTLNKLQP